MSSQINCHGLSRSIPAGIKREVRQRCGFGCVICGQAFFQYDHLDPPFSEAAEHRADGIVLLCPNDHQRKTLHQLSDETVRAFSLAPKAKTRGYSFGPLDIGTSPPTIILGEITCIDVDSLISVEGESIFSILPPESPGGPYRLSALLADAKGKEIFRISENEFKTSVDSWDVLWKGSRLQINAAAGKISLILRTEPPGRIVVERLVMAHRGMLLVIQEGTPTKITMCDGAEVGITEMVLSGSTVGIDLRKSGIGYGGPQRPDGAPNVLQIKSMTYGPKPGAAKKVFHNELCQAAFELLDDLVLKLNPTKNTTPESVDRWEHGFMEAQKKASIFLASHLKEIGAIDENFVGRFTKGFELMLIGLKSDRQVRRLAQQLDQPIPKANDFGKYAKQFIISTDDFLSKLHK